MIVYVSRRGTPLRKTIFSVILDVLSKFAFRYYANTFIDLGSGNAQAEESEYQVPKPIQSESTTLSRREHSKRLLPLKRKACSLP